MTHRFLTITGISTLVMLMSTTLFASGFCDDTPSPADTRGGYCTQVRETFQDFDGTILPDYSDLDFLRMLGSGISIVEFELDVTNLFPSGLVESSATETTVLELQLEKVASGWGSSTAHQALLLKVSRDFDGNLTLGFDWLGVPAYWSITTQTLPAPADTWRWVVPAALQATVFKVQLVPSTDWKSIDAWLTTMNGVQGEPSLQGVNHRVFTLPAGGPQKAKAWRLRSGILAGTLTQAGMQAQFSYMQPYIDQPYR